MLRFKYSKLLRALAPSSAQYHKQISCLEQKNLPDLKQNFCLILKQHLIDLQIPPEHI